MELNLPVKEALHARELLHGETAGSLVYEGLNLGKASWTGSVYPFGIGMLELSFYFEGEINAADQMAIFENRLLIGKYTLPIFFRNLRELLTDKTRSFAHTIYQENPEVEEEIFALYELIPWQSELKAEGFIKKNYNHLFGIVTGEPSSDILSEYAMEKETLKNIGYYETEIILVKHFGAFIHSKESKTLKNLISLGLAQYFNIKASNAFLQGSLARVQKVLERQPPYHHFWKMPAAYQRLSSAQLAFSKAKVSVVESLHTASALIPQIDSDWHLKSVYNEILSAFNLEEQTKIAMLRLETIDSIYSQLGEQVSTIFFIFLDFVFLTWLLVDLGGWFILLFKSKAF